MATLGNVGRTAYQYYRNYLQQQQRAGQDPVKLVGMHLLITSAAVLSVLGYCFPTRAVTVLTSKEFLLLSMTALVVIVDIGLSLWRRRDGLKLVPLPDSINFEVHTVKCPLSGIALKDHPSRSLKLRDTYFDAVSLLYQLSQNKDKRILLPRRSPLVEEFEEALTDAEMRAVADFFYLNSDAFLNLWNPAFVEYIPAQRNEQILQMLATGDPENRREIQEAYRLLCFPAPQAPVDRAPRAADFAAAVGGLHVAASAALPTVTCPLSGEKIDRALRYTLGSTTYDLRYLLLGLIADENRRNPCEGTVLNDSEINQLCIDLSIDPDAFRNLWSQAEMMATEKARVSGTDLATEDGNQVYLNDKKDYRRDELFNLLRQAETFDSHPRVTVVQLEAVLKG